jgi:hypothetical protein
MLYSVDRARLLARHGQLQTWRRQILAKPFNTGQVLTALQAALTVARLRSRAVGC